MIFLYVLNTLLFAPTLFLVLFYSGFWYLVGLVFRSKKLKLYSRNLALGVWDQGLATIWGQAPDISISEALGLARIMHESGEGKASKFILAFGDFVDWIFCNGLYCIEKNHIKNSIDHGESWKNTVTHWHFSDSDTNSREVES